jgi:hypothetical protein
MIADGKEVAGFFFFFLNFPRKLLGLDCIMIKKNRRDRGEFYVI